MKQRNVSIYPLIAVGVAAVALFAFIHHRNRVRALSAQATISAPDQPDAVSPTPAAQPAAPLIGQPLADALSRVTKKAFGLYVTPKDSPVSPERFQGYHTGVDFETTPDEQPVDVPVSAVCDGPLLLKEWVSGYGGVAVQACKIAGQDVTIVYGHLRFSSVTAAAHQQLKEGDQLGVLGKGFSSETDGERKHLHLGIHKGTSIDIKGYVQTKAELGQWVDAMTYLKS